MLTRHKAAIDRLLRPLSGWLGRSGIHPSVLTLATPALTTWVCFHFFQSRSVILFCVSVLLVGCFDVLDGSVARAAGKTSAVGAYLDAMCDRYVDIIVAITVAAVTGLWLLCMIVLTGGLLVSYAKARAAMEVPVDNLEWPDLMERAERGVLFLAGLAAGAYVPWRPLGRDLFWWTLVVLAVLIHLTVIQRMARAVKFITQRSKEKR